MVENRALGKGLSALIPDKQHVAPEEIITFIRTEDIQTNMFQPRADFNDEKLSELVESIKEKGMLQPLLVRKKGVGYELIAGERRLRAAKVLNIREVPAVIKEVSDREALVLALVENIQRQELNPLEEAQGFQRLIKEFHLTQEEVAKSIGMNRATIANMLRILKLSDDIKQAIYEGLLSMGHARALVGVEDLQKQKKLFQKTITKGLSVRELESLIKQDNERVFRRKKRKGSTDPYILSLEDELSKRLGTKVVIKAKKKRGTIIIEYYSLDDLDRILSCIKR